ncbi:MAG: ABC transporter substrate-binding protein [Lachnospiraceae bacterium]|nr:ABC transporter substrate-binding protein [Lachnospiraceae bacterium]MDY6222156.1 ABC transporter substrate-binding protein [Candidatus Alectryocaccobium sp.]
MKKIIVFVLCFALVLSLVACSTTGNDTQESNDTIVVKDMKGEVTIPADPQRIVDVAGLTEELLILNMNVIASANTSMFDGVSVPEHLRQLFSEKDIEVVGNYSGASSTGDLNLEKIAELKPDLIIMNIRHDKVYEQLKSIAPTVMIDDDISYVNWRGRFQQLGTWFNKEADVEKWLADYDANAAELASKIHEVVGNETFAVIEANSVNFGSYYVYRTGGAGELIYDELKLIPSAGVPDGVWGEVVDAEYFSLIDADHIFFFSDDGTIGDTGNLAAWQNLKAVQAGNVYYGNNETQYNLAYTAMGKVLYLEKLTNAVLNHGNVE